jgi:hypothetical protein
LGFFRVDASGIGCIPDADGETLGFKARARLWESGKWIVLSDLRIVGRVCDWGSEGDYFISDEVQEAEVGEVWHFDVVDC